MTDRDIKSAVASGAQRIANVYESLGAAPQCAKCTTNIRDIIRESAGNNAPVTVRR
ncbi:(2Fe-2S)-binding protein [Sneathiella sp. CAU 1612]|uniref:(2Fe-2S)-binding protein n=1 Tax=Sneathiella sedimenti TaxID=2816034 RepID=A0ABS3F9G8_9PROT|nr:(2Fe-2S)-binding protein [Sneathiella sedimenti]